MKLRLERQDAVPTGAAILLPPLAALLGLAAGALVLLLAGHDPLAVYGALLAGSLGSAEGRAATLAAAAPLILAGLGASVAFRMKVWNLGTEGQLLLGAVAAAGAALALPEAPAWLLLPAMALAGALGGALWALIPGALRVFAAAGEPVTSLLLNYVALALAEYLAAGPWRHPAGLPGSAPIPAAGWLPSLPGGAHLGLAIALAAALILALALRRTAWGYELRVAGESEAAARYAGIDVRRNLLLAMALSGGLAGLAGMIDLGGGAHQLRPGLAPGVGYAAIAVAWLGRLNPWGIVAAAGLGAVLLAGGGQERLAAPAAVAPLLQGALLLFALGGETLLRYRIVRAGERR